MAISKRELTRIGFDPRQGPDISPEKRDPDITREATEISIRPIFSTGRRGRDRTGIAHVAAGILRNPISDNRSAQGVPMTPRQDAGTFALTRAEIGRSKPLKAEWL
jgi:hypothetical protein